MNQFSAHRLSKMDQVMWGLNHELPSPRMVQFFAQVDFSNFEMIRRQFEEKGLARPSYTAFVVWCVSRAITANAFVNQKPFRWLWIRRLIKFNSIHVSVAVERDHSERTAGPEVVRNVDQLTLEEIFTKLKEFSSPHHAQATWGAFEQLVKKYPVWLVKILVAMPRFVPSLWLKYRGGAVLVSSPAKYGVDMIAASWQWPVAFSFGRIQPMPFVVDERLEVRRGAVLGMTFDPNLMLGAPAARFFNCVVGLLNDPPQDLFDTQTFEKRTGIE